MTEQEFNALRESAWRRELTAVEEAQVQAYLAAHPEAQAGWESEAGLNRLLAELADAPVSSNFTSRVMQAVERDWEAATGRAPRRWLGRVFGDLRRLVPRVGWALGAVALALLSYRGYDKYQMDRGVAMMADNYTASPAPPAKVFADYDAIQMLPADTVMDNLLYDSLRP